MQTEETVRAFSGTLRRISGGGVVVSSFDPLTASAIAAADILVDGRNAPALIFSFDVAAMEKSIDKHCNCSKKNCVSLRLW